LQPTQTSELAQTLSGQPHSSPHRLTEFERIAQHMYTQNLTLVQTNRTLSVLRAIDLLTLESSRDLRQLSTDIAKAITKSTPYGLVGILTLNQHSDTVLHFQGYSLNELPSQKIPENGASELLGKLFMTVDDQWLRDFKGSLTIDLNKSDFAKNADLFGAHTEKTLGDITEMFNLHSLYLTRLRARNNLSGIMLIGLQDTLPKIEDIELIERISEPAGIAIDNRLLLEENQRIIKQLQQSNDKLKEVDQTKDEFISMASHQLRTPLTSVKGYVSMVLEGEAGEINQGQRQMLQQAFDSSQRMVYLIADFLNVSRIQTGKFTMVNTITNLSEVVKSELLQLEAGAKSRKVTFTYNESPHIPTVLIDETKIRQVIMNFLDNSLYYSSEGDVVNVELRADEQAIDFVVHDHGMGVPKADQPHLFTKFYRAANARKSRPDGTGLGLFMARKVVVAQGGAILFKSTEGKGSSFGFRFPLDKVRVTS